MEAILFDCDGVLVDSEIVGLEDAIAFLADHGLPFAQDDLIRRFTGMRSDLMSEGLRRDYDAALGRPATDEEFKALYEGFVGARRSRRHEVRLIEGAKDALCAVTNHAPLKLAVASSSAQHFLDDKIDRFGLRPYVHEHVYSADAVAHGKPAPDIFLYAADRLGADISRCLVIEDSPNGVMAGVASGATVWGFTGGGHCLSDHAERLRESGAKTVFADHAALMLAIMDL